MLATTWRAEQDTKAVRFCKYLNVYLNLQKFEVYILVLPDSMVVQNSDLNNL